MGRVMPVFRWPDPCPAAHDPYPHQHGPRHQSYRLSCSGRYWCRSCWRWYGGEACEPGRAVPRVLAA